MNRAPAAGDIISIKHVELVVIRAGRLATSTMYSFDTIKRNDLGKVNAKTTSWQLFEGDELCQLVRLSDIIFHEQIKLKTKVETTYTEK